MTLPPFVLSSLRCAEWELVQEARFWHNESRNCKPLHPELGHGYNNGYNTPKSHPLGIVGAAT